MGLLEHVKFEFTSEAFPADTFAVTGFTGEEGLSQCYRFEIDLASDQADLDLEKILQSPAALTIIDEELGDLRFQGVVTHLDLTHKYKEYRFFRAVLTPGLQWMDLIHHSQVFLDQTVEDVLEQLLQDAGLFSTDYAFRMSDRQFDPPQQLRCQYRQSHLDFFSFWAEHMGMYYFFEQPDFDEEADASENGNQNEKLIVTNNRLAHSRLSKQGWKLHYVPPSGLDVNMENRALPSFTCRRRRLPGRVLVRDYDYNQPSLDLTAEAQVEAGGPGQVYLFSDHVHFDNEEAGEHLARIRAEELNCRKQVFLGRSHSTLVRSGYIFEVADHFEPELNRDYLATRVTHRGNQFKYLAAGLREAVGDDRGTPVYENEFEAIPADVQFRAERKTPASQIRGTMSAFIDAAGSGEFAELDDEGRYKVVLPFDLGGSRRTGLKASAWLRMAQPFTGSNRGMHFPLHKGAEVLLSFEAGDPNRPVIMGSVPNAANRSIVRADNVNLSGIRMPTGSSMVFGDHQGGASATLNASVGEPSSPSDPGSPSDGLSKGALISLKNDHAWAETMTSAGSVNAFAGIFSNEVCGAIKSAHTSWMSRQLVGAPVFQALNQLATSLIKGVPSLLVTMAKDGLSVGKLAYDQEKDWQKRGKEDQIKDFYNDRKDKVDEGETSAGDGSSAESLDDRVRRMEEEREREEKKKALDDERDQKIADWDRHYDQEKTKADQAFTYTKTGLSFASALLMPVWNLWCDIVLKKVVKDVLTKLLKGKMNTGAEIPEEAFEAGMGSDLREIVSGDFAYSVISDGDCVQTQAQSGWGRKWFLGVPFIKKSTTPINNMMFYEGVGHQVMWAKKHMIVKAEEDHYAIADKVMHGAQHLMYQAWKCVRVLGTHIDHISRGSIRLMTLDRDEWNRTQKNQWLKPPDSRKGIEVIAHSDHDIWIGQDGTDGGKKGVCTLFSNEKIHLECDQATIDIGKVGANPRIQVVYGDDAAVTVWNRGILLECGDTQINVEKNGVKVQTSAGLPLFQAQGGRVTINGDLKVTGEFDQPDQVNK